jgi:hypothetical protein
MEIEYILNHAECAISLAENQAQMEKILSVKKGLPLLKTLIIMDPEFSKGPGRKEGMTILTFKEVQDKGSDYLAKHPGCVEEAIAQGKPEELVTIIYTSGTTGEPKGVMLNNRNYMHQIRAPNTPLDIRRGDIFMSVLPVWHSYERAIEYVAVFKGCSIAYSKLISQVLVEDMGKVRPMIFPSQYRRRGRLEEEPGLFLYRRRLRPGQDEDPVPGSHSAVPEAKPLPGRPGRNRTPGAAHSAGPAGAGAGVQQDQAPAGRAIPFRRFGGRGPAAARR